MLKNEKYLDWVMVSLTTFHSLFETQKDEEKTYYEDYLLHSPNYSR
jgi:hypothetical protein